MIKYCLDLRKPDLRKNLDLRKIVAKTDFLVHKFIDANLSAWVQFPYKKKPVVF